MTFSSFPKSAVILGASALLFLASCGGGSSASSSATATTTASSKADKIAQGEKLYAQYCVACHQATGLGLPNLFPPLAASDYIKGNKDRAIVNILKGQTGEVVVNGAKFNSAMPPVKLSDDEVASVLTYVYNSWGNDGTEVAAADVAKLR